VQERERFEAERALVQSIEKKRRKDFLKVLYP
jgi:hypothetical protein